jgi:predicted transcriptional regulator
MSVSKKTTHISAHVPSDLAQEVDRIASAIQRSPDWVIARALSYYCRDEGADILADAEGPAARESAEKLGKLRQEVDIGVEDAAAGRFSEKTVKELADEVRRERFGD